MSENKTNLTVIVDNVGRTIVGELKSLDSNKNLILQNAAVLYVASDEENKGRITVQMVPLFFREFLANKESSVLAHYNNGNYVLLDIEDYDGRMLQQYQQTFSKPVAATSPQQTESKADEPKIVNLFEDNK